MRTLDLLSSQLGISECSQVCTSEHPIDTEKTLVPRLVVRNVPIIQVGNNVSTPQGAPHAEERWSHTCRAVIEFSSFCGALNLLSEISGHL